MATIYTTGAAASPRADSHYSGAAALCAAIRAAAETAPEIAPEMEFPDRYAAGPYPFTEPAEIEPGAVFYMPIKCAAPLEIISDAPACRFPRLNVHPEKPGPFLPIRADRKAVFHYTATDARGSLTVANVRPALLALADKVHANRGAFDGKAKRAKCPVAVSGARGSAPHVAARALWEARQYADALQLAGNVGALFFGHSGEPGAHPYMQAEALGLVGHSFTVARSIRGGRFRVLHTASGLEVSSVKVGAPWNGFSTYSAARDWIETAMLEDAFRDRISAAAVKAAPMDQAAARAFYLADIDEPAADAPEAAATAPADAPTAIGTSEPAGAPVVAAIVAPVSETDAAEARAIVEGFYDDNLRGAPGERIPVEKMEARAAHLRGSAAGFADHAPARGAVYAEAARMLEIEAAAKRREIANPGPSWMTYAARRVYAVHCKTAATGRAIDPSFSGMLRRPRSAGFLAEFNAPHVRAHRNAMAAAVRTERSAKRAPVNPGPAAPSGIVDAREVFDAATRAAAIELERITCILPSDSERRRIIDAGRRGAIGARLPVVLMLERFADGNPGDIGTQAARRALADLDAADAPPTREISSAAAEHGPVPSESGASRVSASWVIRDKSTGAVIMETFDRRKVDALNTAKYEAVPIIGHLAGLSRREPVPEVSPPPSESEADETTPAPLDGLDVAELTGPDALQAFEDAARAAAWPVPVAAVYRETSVPRLAYPSLRIPASDLRARIPARFAPGYIIHA